METSRKHAGLEGTMCKNISLNVDNTIYETHNFRRESPGVKYDVNLPDKIIAPIPGTIQKIEIQVGSEIKKGNILYILDAMKTYNQMISDYSGIITDILVKKGDKVKKGQTIMLMKQKTMVVK